VPAAGPWGPSRDAKEMAAMRCWFHVEHHAVRPGDWPHEELYEMERWSLAALSGFRTSSEQ